MKTSLFIGNIQLLSWKDMPNFDLYSDQLLNIINKETNFLIDLGLATPLTSSMINNYVKHGLMPKPKKKRYQREHLAHLMAITLLKPILSMQEITAATQLTLQHYTIEEAYGLLCQSFEKNLASLNHLTTEDNTQLKFDNSHQKLLPFHLLTLSLVNKFYVQDYIRRQLAEQSGKENDLAESTPKNS